MILSRKQFLLSVVGALIPNRFKKPPIQTTPLIHTFQTPFIEPKLNGYISSKGLDEINAITLKYIKANFISDSFFKQSPFSVDMCRTAEIEAAGGILIGPYYKMPGEKWKRRRKTL